MALTEILWMSCKVQPERRGREGPWSRYTRVPRALDRREVSNAADRSQN